MWEVVLVPAAAYTAYRAHVLWAETAALARGQPLMDGTALRASDGYTHRVELYKREREERAPIMVHAADGSASYPVHQAPALRTRLLISRTHGVDGEEAPAPLTNYALASPLPHTTKYLDMEHTLTAFLARHGVDATDVEGCAPPLVAHVVAISPTAPLHVSHEHRLVGADALSVARAVAWERDGGLLAGAACVTLLSGVALACRQLR
jgi:hypothetical protein